MASKSLIPIFNLGVLSKRESLQPQTVATVQAKKCGRKNENAAKTK